MFECSKCQRTFTTNHQLEEHQCLKKLTLKRRPTLTLKPQKEMADLTDLWEIIDRLREFEVKYRDLKINLSDPIDVDKLKQLIHMEQYHQMYVLSMIMVNKHYLTRLINDLRFMENWVEECDPTKKPILEVIEQQILVIRQGLQALPYKMNYKSDE